MNSAGEDIARGVYVVADNILSPLGKTTAANFAALKAGRTAVIQRSDPALSARPFFAALFDGDETFLADSDNRYTRFERMLVASVADALQISGIDAENSRTVLIVSSTKGNIGLLDTEVSSPELNARIALPASAKLVAAHFGFVNAPVVISNACISGVLALITAMRLLKSGQYDHAVVTGADEVSRFVLSGFQSFQALSDAVCKPFDSGRNGLNLGEGAATVILSTNSKYKDNLQVLGGSVSNDANHISGPSRTGEELGQAIKDALANAGKRPADIGFISAHGTATPYNDEMEASAITFAGLQNTPINSLKGYYGHTLGAAGLIESVISIQEAVQGLLIATPGYEHNGVTHEMKVSPTQTMIKTNTFLKTASGFGGCNAAMVIGKK
ncbi:beta-ketoacyl synthase [Mucilaginibacter sp. PAMC 26640]|nr:beta-ketoacyl synthase [Mucilaginibacter sp. PAMC 26640]